MSSNELAMDNARVDSTAMSSIDNIYEKMEVFETEMEMKSSCINGKVSVSKFQLIIDFAMFCIQSTLLMHSF